MGTEKNTKVGTRTKVHKLQMKHCATVFSKSTQMKTVICQD